MDNIPLQSPLDQFCYQMDKKLLNKSIFDYYEFVEGLEPNYVSNLTLADWKYRYANQLNVLIEIYGQQGSGKSLIGQHMAISLGSIFEMPFNMELHTVADFDLLNKLLNEEKYRTTFIVDEQPRAFFGYGSTRVSRSLTDFEEVCRYTMKNIIYISPTERDHSSYYVFKEDQKPSVERNRNNDCLTCAKQKKCLKIYAENRFKTLCGIDFWERHGYPTAFTFMLCYPRKTDNRLMPRGYVRFPILPPELMKKYDVIKKKNLDIYQSNESAGWSEQRKQLKEFQEQFRDRLSIEGKVVNKNLIKAYLMDYFGGRAFTTTEMDIMTALIKAEINSVDFSDKVQKGYNEEKDL